MNTKRIADPADTGTRKRRRSRAPIGLSPHRGDAEFEFAAQYCALFENNPLPMWVIDRQSLAFLAANRAAVRQCGYSKAEFARMTVLHLHPPEDRPRLRRNLSRSEEPRHAAYLSQHLKKDGTLIDVEVYAEPLTLQGRPIRLAVALDITKRRQAESRAASLAKFPDENPNPALRISSDGVVAYHNKPSEVLLRAWGCSKGHLRSSKWLRLVRMAYDSGWPQQHEIECGEQVFALTLAPIPEFGYVNIYALDVTERKRLERAVLEISEQEQRRMGLDLHDHLNQQLAGIAYLTDVLAKRLARKPLPEAKLAVRATELLNQAVRDVRSLAKGLFPVKPEANGLVTALQDFARSVRDTYHIACGLRCDAPVAALDNATGTHLFRIAQEAVRNAIRHGRASNIVMELGWRRDAIFLRVKNDGRDFPAKLPNHGGMGLEIMKYRAHTIGGKLEIRRAPGGGTILTCGLDRPDR